MDKSKRAMDFARKEKERLERLQNTRHFRVWKEREMSKLRKYKRRHNK